MATKPSMKMKGKEVGPADVYAGRYKEAKAELNARPDMGKVENVNIGVGNLVKREPGVKTDGIKIRGTGCATKGVMARGPMA
ncbi:hypothetical protein EBT31_17035 [bacterium]|jgi:hypothetical protein|nr:hypothetical protein [bacterium]